MNASVIEAIGRLAEAIKDRPRVHAWKGRSHTVSVAEVRPVDVIELCDALPEHPRTKHLRDSCANAECATVGINVVDVAFLIAQGETLAPA